MLPEKREQAGRKARGMASDALYVQKPPTQA